MYINLYFKVHVHVRQRYEPISFDLLYKFMVNFK